MSLSRDDARTAFAAGYRSFGPDATEGQIQWAFDARWNTNTDAQEGTA
jgi:hypothetical protein